MTPFYYYCQNPSGFRFRFCHLIFVWISKFKGFWSQMAYNKEYVLSECPRVKRGLTVCKKLKQVRNMNAKNFSTCRLNCKLCMLQSFWPFAHLDSNRIDEGEQKFKPWVRHFYWHWACYLWSYHKRQIKRAACKKLGRYKRIKWSAKARFVTRSDFSLVKFYCLNFGRWLKLRVMTIRITQIQVFTNASLQN